MRRFRQGTLLASRVAGLIVAPMMRPVARADDEIPAIKPLFRKAGPGFAMSAAPVTADGQTGGCPPTGCRPPAVQRRVQEVRRDDEGREGHRTHPDDARPGGEGCATSRCTRSAPLWRPSR